MKKKLGILAIIAFAFCMVSCDEIMSFFDKQVNSLVGSIEGIEMNKIKTGGIDESDSYGDALGTLMDENAISKGNGKVNTSFNAIMSDAESVKDLDFTEGIVCVYFHKDDDSGFNTVFAALANDWPRCQFYSFDTDDNPVPAEWIDAANSHGATFNDKGECADEGAGEKPGWKVWIADGAVKTQDDGVSFYVLSNSKVLMQINGKSNKTQLEKMLGIAERKLSYRLKAKKMHWGAGYSIEDHLYDVVSNEDFDIQVNFKVENEVAKQKVDQDLDTNKNQVALILFYRTFPRQFEMGHTGSYKSEDMMLGVIDKGDVPDDLELTPLEKISLRINNKYTVYDMNFAQTLPDVKFIKCNAFGNNAEKKPGMFEKNGAISKYFKRDYSSYITVHEESNIGYDWLVDGIKKFGVTAENPKPMYGFMLDGIELNNGAWTWPEKEEDVAKLTKLKEEYTRSLWVISKNGAFAGIACTKEDFPSSYSMRNGKEVSERFNGITEVQHSSVRALLQAAQAK